MGSGSRAATSCTSPDRARRGRRGSLAGLGLLAALAAGPAQAETQVEPVLRITLEGAYDSNPLYDGRSDQRLRMSPELGVKLRDPLWAFSGVYSPDYLSYRKLDPAGVWNQRGSLELEAKPSERSHVVGSLHGTYAIDPIGLAQAGIFRTGQQRALLLQGFTRTEVDLSHGLIGAAEFTERLVRFEDQTGGAMHAPEVEVLHPLDERLFVGGGYAFTIFQDYIPTGNTIATAQALRARLRYKVTRFLEGDAFAGPAFWSGPGSKAVVPEAGVELRLTERDWDLRLTLFHGLGLGSTADPGLGNTVEFGTVRRFGRTFDLRADGGYWQSGEVPTGANPTQGLALSGEAGWHVTREVRLAVFAAWAGRLDDPSPTLRRANVGVRMGWELPVR